MLEKLIEYELRQTCRSRLEMLESWLRRLIDQRLNEIYGGNLTTAKRGNAEYVVKASIRASVSDRISREPDRFQRPIDSATLEDAIAIICHPETFKDFREPLALAFPQGNSEAREFLSRLQDPRNRLSHDNPISVRQAEQVICYSGDVIASIRSYYEHMGHASEFNVPRIIRYWDSLGNVIHADLSTQGFMQVSIPRTPANQLRPGDILTIELEVDPSFHAEGFNVSWQFPNSHPPLSGEKLTRVSVLLENKHVSEHMVLFIDVRSHKDWHRLSNCDVGK